MSKAAIEYIIRFQIRKDRTGTRASLLPAILLNGEVVRKDSYAVVTGVILVVPVRIETFVLHLTLRLTRGEIGGKPASTLERRLAGSALHVTSNVTPITHLLHGSPYREKGGRELAPSHQVRLTPPPSPPRIFAVTSATLSTHPASLYSRHRHLRFIFSPQSLRDVLGITLGTTKFAKG